jgi:hypothetical protein
LEVPPTFKGDDIGIGMFILLEEEMYEEDDRRQ